MKVLYAGVKLGLKQSVTDAAMGERCAQSLALELKEIQTSMENMGIWLEQELEMKEDGWVSWKAESEIKEI